MTLPDQPELPITTASCSPQPPALPKRELTRVARQLSLPGFGIEQQTKLHNTHALVIGAGGLGCPLMQQLAAAGVGYITIIDDDTVALSNIHRQILFGVSDIGRHKAVVAAERLEELQPGIHVEAIIDRFTQDNALGLLGGVDILIDGSDNFDTKFLAADAAEITGTPLVWGTVLRFHGDVAAWWSGPGTPDGGVGMRDLFPEQPSADSVPDCATAGVLGVTTSVVAGLMATEVIKFSAGLGISWGRLLSYDALSAELRHFTVPADPGRTRVTNFSLLAETGSSNEEGSAGRTIQNVHTENVHTEERNESSLEDGELLARLGSGEFHALDVREVHEKLIRDLPSATVNPGYHLPWSLAQQQPEAVYNLLDSIDPHTSADLVVYCASGIRSAAFIEVFGAYASNRGLKLHNLRGGANEHGV